MSGNAVNPRLTPVLIAGPTAVGKSEVALLLAEKLNGEIISVDSMQVYRGLDIGTAKPSSEERRRVPHHLIDVASLTESFDAARFAQRAIAETKKIQQRGRVPILCGGTGLYFKAYLQGLGEAPPSDAPLRARLERTPLADLLEDLQRLDPATFQTIDRSNPRRVVRAIEVIRLTGKPFSIQRAAWDGGSGKRSGSDRVVCFGLARETEDLRRRIDARVDTMFAGGLVEETQQLLEQGLAANRTAMQAIGYRQVVEHLRGERPLAETLALVKTRTRQFAKRQMTWFRRQLELIWLPVESDEASEHVAARLMEQPGVISEK